MHVKTKNLIGAVMHSIRSVHVPTHQLSLDRNREALSPIERRGRYFFKREDLHFPVLGSPLNGGKMRQCLLHLEAVQASGVVTISSIHSPQSAIVACCAAAMGKTCSVVVGGKIETKYLSLATEYGASIVRVKSGRHTALWCGAEKIAKSENLHPIGFGMRMTVEPRRFYARLARQVQNVPEKIDTIVVTCGSGVTAAAIIYGYWLLARSIPRLVLISTGPDRRAWLTALLQTLCGAVPFDLNCWGRFEYYSLEKETRFRYEQLKPFSLCGIEMHPQYEAKTFRWATEALKLRSETTLFWVTGSDI